MRKAEMLLAIVRAQHKRGGTKIFLQEGRGNSVVPGPEHLIPCELSAEPGEHTRPGPSARPVLPHVRRDILHECQFVFWAYMMLATVACQPGIDQQVIERHAPHLVTTGLARFQFANMLSDKRQ